MEELFLYTHKGEVIMEIIAAIVITTLILVVILFGLFSKPEHGRKGGSGEGNEDKTKDSIDV